MIVILSQLKAAKIERKHFFDLFVEEGIERICLNLYSNAYQFIVLDKF